MPWDLWDPGPDAWGVSRLNYEEGRHDRQEHDEAAYPKQPGSFRVSHYDFTLLTTQILDYST